MKNTIKEVILFMMHLYVYSCIIIIVIVSSLHIYLLIIDKDHYGWPAITQCRICNKTVWAWQDHKIINFKVSPKKKDFNNKPDKSIQLIKIGMSGIVHSNCTGTPNIKIDIEIK